MTDTLQGYIPMSTQLEEALAANRRANAIIAQQADEMAAMDRARREAVDEALRIMTQLDDLGEALALGIEAYYSNHDIEEPESCPDLHHPLVAWRAMRPVKGLV